MTTQSTSPPFDGASILGSGEYSDYEIECRGYIFKVHKVILTSASKFFQAAFNSRMKESTDGKINCDDDEPSVIARTLIFIYTGYFHTGLIHQWHMEGTSQFRTVHDSVSTPAGRDEIDSKIVLYVKMYQQGNKLFIPSLKDGVRNEFLQLIYGSGKGDNCFSEPEERHIDIVIKLIDLVYSSTVSSDWGLRDIVLNLAMICIHEYEGMNTASMNQALRDIDGLAIDIVSSPRTNNPKTCLKCGVNVWPRLWRCKCGKLKGCADQQCCDLRTKRSICTRCAEFGVVEYEPVV